MLLCMCLLISVNYQDGSVKTVKGGKQPLQCHRKQRWSEGLNLSNIHCGTFGGLLFV